MTALMTVRPPPIRLSSQSGSPCHSVPTGGRLASPELGRSSPPSRHWRRHYLHSAAPPCEPGPRFPPLRLLGRLPPEYVAAPERQASENP
jgi:hypothetical protein